ncbi:Peptidoglycan-associated lipoprotein [Rhodovastum atsumiense]|uniref:Peptidoglycan-associated lipoprotein n=1 Tax=Rhodovastum atsumiense TaxID=504468 RepID=A0A5M6IPJ5_9PROT|nr:peptidoglycan-associated lipoprotein Pal [Rhodovastum atsumiense]KAA5610203.1 peptidoglycan-associated lipoprotein Pal [Rhodovastum atsumiense]CAH2604183.1 Peptidoglycan-associated lipoprotein [Rhodovastum atsumiense]
MRRIWLVLAATAMLAACTSGSDTGNSAGSGASTAGNGGPLGGYGSTGVGSSSLNGPGGAGALAEGVPDRVLFDTDRSTLNSEAQAVLSRQAAWLQQNPRVAVQIAGNCDERGTQEYNLALGQRRAIAARDFLVSHGVQASRLSTISYGKDRPVALGSTPDAWAQNRNAIASTH